MDSFVRLNGIDNIHNSRAKVLKPLFTPLPEFGISISNYKCERIYVGGRYVDRLILGDGIDEVIECSPEVINQISDDYRPPQIIGVRALLDSDDSVSCMAFIRFDSEGVTTMLYPRANLSINQVEMFLSSL